MDEPLQLNSMGFFDFIARSELVVLFLSVHPAHRFNHLLCERFAEEKGTEVAFGQLHLLELFASATPALSFLRGEIIECGAPVPLAVPPGYYLFQHGHMLAWDSGLPSTVDVKRIIRGSMLGAVFSLFARNLSFVGMALRHAAEDAVCGASSVSISASGSCPSRKPSASLRAYRNCDRRPYECLSRVAGGPLCE